MFDWHRCKIKASHIVFSELAASVTIRQCEYINSKYWRVLSSGLIVLTKCGMNLKWQKKKNRAIDRCHRYIGDKRQPRSIRYMQQYYQIINESFCPLIVSHENSMRMWHFAFISILVTQHGRNKFSSLFKCHIN